MLYRIETGSTNVSIGEIMRNLHKFYFKDYFDGINLRDIDCSKNQDKIKRRNSTLISAELAKVSNEVMNCSFSCVVAYPGLVTGVGIKHEAKIKGEFKLGMHFDYTYGMPVVYGSSVKGVLSSYFVDVFNDEFKKLHPGVDAETLRKEIFEGTHNGTPISIYERDIFLDAVVTEKDEKGRFLVSDSITPHTEGALKNPIPLTFMKIAPGCTLEFRFKLRESLVFDISVADKLEIFKKIIGLYGVGAKTNVGYGQFDVVGE